MEVDIYLDKVIGKGRFGAVYGASCDQLPCVAKYFDCEGLSENEIMKIEMDCQLTNTVRHPNIVQYLGTVRHMPLNKPIVLLELMEENLAQFLTRRNGFILEYCTKVNITHDVALALAYLHNNDIIHGYLSGSNVLMIGESRAKVTDFWMLRLQENYPKGKRPPPTENNLAFMAPESVTDAPVFSKASDSYSFGRLGIFVDTQRLPKPDGNNYDAENDNNGDYGDSSDDDEYDDNDDDDDDDDDDVSIQGAEEALNNEATKKADRLSLKRIILNCLKKDSSIRPSFKTLCDQLAKLKEYPAYSEDMKAFHAVSKKQQKAEIQQLTAKVQQLSAKVQELSAKVQELEDAMEENDRVFGKQLEKVISERDKFEKSGKINQHIAEKLILRVEDLEAALTNHPSQSPPSSVGVDEIDTGDVTIVTMQVFQRKPLQNS